MAENILVMDVEGTDGRERGEDQDFERKSDLFALAAPLIFVDNTSVVEGDTGLTNALFTVRLSAASLLPVSAAFATASGSATLYIHAGEGS